MKNIIYDIFYEKWLKGRNATIWLYSDPHFNDPDLQTMRSITPEEQVKRINSKVGRNDIIIFLGDIGDVEYIKQVRGYKILIQGNHDKGKTVYEEYFDEVYDGELIISSKIKLSHIPNPNPYILNIHGHCHPYKELNFGDKSYKEIVQEHLDKEKKNKSTTLNICAEYLNYYPINLNDIVKSGILKNVKDIVRDLIDNKK